MQMILPVWHFPKLCCYCCETGNLHTYRRCFGICRHASEGRSSCYSTVFVATVDAVVFQNVFLAGNFCHCCCGFTFFLLILINLLMWLVSSLWLGVRVRVLVSTRRTMPSWCSSRSVYVHVLSLPGSLGLVSDQRLFSPRESVRRVSRTCDAIPHVN